LVSLTFSFSLGFLACCRLPPRDGHGISSLSLKRTCGVCRAHRVAGACVPILPYYGPTPQAATGHRIFFCPHSAIILESLSFPRVGIVFTAYALTPVPRDEASASLCFFPLLKLFCTPSFLPKGKQQGPLFSPVGLLIRRPVT